jgi:hypothetical protein
VLQAETNQLRARRLAALDAQLAEVNKELAALPPPVPPPAPPPAPPAVRAVLPARLST